MAQFKRLFFFFELFNKINRSNNIRVPLEFYTQKTASLGLVDGESKRFSISCSDTVRALMGTLATDLIGS